MRGVSVTADSEAGVSVGISWAYALLHKLLLALKKSTVTTSRVNRTLYLTAALLFIFSPYNEIIGLRHVNSLSLKFKKLIFTSRNHF